ncbi:MAG: UbiA prenyltransferase family protein [Verrucomicrobiales bacterium]
MKSGFCLAALFFSGRVGDSGAWLAVWPLLLAVSLLASAGYLWNDLVNVAEDRHHPRKKKRPLASGRMRKREALALALGVAGLAFALLWWAYGGGRVFWLGAAYLALTVNYTLWLRSLPLLDVLTLSGGFVIRVLAGAYAIGVAPTWWLVLCTYALALLLGFGKRRGELVLLKKDHEKVGSTRSVLQAYNLMLLDSALGLSAVLCVGAYLSYVVGKGGFLLAASVIPVILGVSDYMRVAWRSDEVERPEHLLLKSPVLLGSVAAWLILVILALWPV